MANIKSLISDAQSAIQDFLHSKFELEYTNARVVPTYDDSDLTFERGYSKRGKEINTCVLFVDIRNSVALNKKCDKNTMAKLYAAFTKTIIYAAHNHNGAVRNIIGDRVMVVFQPQNCFVDAIECAISINHICHKIIKNSFDIKDFKCGIGIDYGSMRVIKVGTHKNGAERAASKNLVWVGHPANVASRLTDVANKVIVNQMVQCDIETYVFNYNYGLLGVLGARRVSSDMLIDTVSRQIVKKNVTETLSYEDFIKRLRQDSDGKLTLKDKFGLNDRKLVSFVNQETTLINPPILMTEQVYNEYKKLKQDTENHWKLQQIKVNDYTGKILGSDLTWLIQ